MALVIFIASIMVPTLKMIAIARLCWNANGNGARDSERMHLRGGGICWPLVND